MSVKYPVGVEHGDRVRLLRNVKTKGGDVFPAGMIMIVGEATRSHNGRHGRPRVSLWDPERPCWNEKTQEMARGVRGVERSAYEPTRSENTMRLSKEQQRVLTILGDGKVHGTSTSTYTTGSSTPTVVTGTVASALVRRGLAQHKPLTPDGVYAFGVKITAAGKDALKNERARSRERT